jgi:hypothetical protein
LKLPLCAINRGSPKKLLHAPGENQRLRDCIGAYLVRGAIHRDRPGQLFQTPLKPHAQRTGWRPRSTPLCKKSTLPHPAALYRLEPSSFVSIIAGDERPRIGGKDVHQEFG